MCLNQNGPFSWRTFIDRRDRPLFDITQTVPRGTPVLQVANISRAGELLIPCGIAWDGQETHFGSVSNEGESFEGWALVAHENLDREEWETTIDHVGLVFVRLVLSEDAPAQADGSLRGGRGQISHMAVAFLRSLSSADRDALVQRLTAHHQAPVQEISLEEARRRMPFLERRARRERLLMLQDRAIAPLAFAFDRVASFSAATREAIGRRRE